MQTIYNSQDRSELECPLTDEQRRRYSVVYTQWDISHKKAELLPFAATWIDLEIIIFKGSKTGRERHIPFICGI